MLKPLVKFIHKWLPPPSGEQYLTSKELEERRKAGHDQIVAAFKANETERFRKRIGIK